MAITLFNRQKARKTSMTYLLACLFINFMIAKLSWGEGKFEFSDPERENKVSLNNAIGFTIDPDEFLIAPALDYFITNELSLGPNIQFGISDGSLLLTAAANVKFHFDIKTDDFMKRFKPSIQFGTGVVMLHYNKLKEGSEASSDNTGVGVLFNLGFGFDIFLNNQMALGNHMLFNILTPKVDDRFFFSWHFVTFKYLF